MVRASGITLFRRSALPRRGVLCACVCIVRVPPPARYTSRWLGICAKNLRKGSQQQQQQQESSQRRRQPLIALDWAMEAARRL